MHSNAVIVSDFAALCAFNTRQLRRRSDLPALRPKRPEHVVLYGLCHRRSLHNRRLPLRARRGGGADGGGGGGGERGSAVDGGVLEAEGAVDEVRGGGEKWQGAKDEGYDKHLL